MKQERSFGDAIFIIIIVGNTSVFEGWANIEDEQNVQTRELIS